MVFTTITLASCGGGDVEESGPSGPVVGPQTGECISAKNSQTIGADDCPGQNTGPTTLAINANATDDVVQDEYDVYAIPSDSQITLTSNSGDADLYLYSSLDFSDDTLVCFANKSFREDTCSASVTDGELYAIVYGRESSNYSISVSNDCSVEAINQWVYRNMNDYYLYADQVPTVNPASYSDPSDLVRALRFEELDPYSGVSDAATRDAFFNQGQSSGFGFNWRYDASRNARVIFVYDDSPFGRAGIKRGDTIVSIEGELWNEMSRERFFELVGTADNPRTTNWTFIDGITETTKDVLLTFDEFTVNTVLFVDAFTNPDFSGKIGYLVFNDFLRTSEAELDNAIQRLIDLEVTELILDLRYNPGGFTFIARRLASQIAGPLLDGNTLVRYEHNSKYSNLNFQRNFESATPTLALDRVIVLTTNATASSSELLINSLRPYMEVITIGGTTTGKAFISTARTYCGRSLSAMEAQGVNASGVSVAGGIAADCYAADDTTRNFGINEGQIEGMLGSALDYFVLGSCDNGAALAKRTTQSHSKLPAFRRGAGLTRVPSDGIPAGLE